MKRPPVQLAAVRKALGRLTVLARKHPELLGPPGEANRVGWEEILSEDGMADAMEMFAVRLPRELIERLDRYIERREKERLKQASPSRALNRAEVVRYFLVRGLDEAEPARKGR